MEFWLLNIGLLLVLRAQMYRTPRTGHVVSSAQDNVMQFPRLGAGEGKPRTRQTYRSPGSSHQQWNSVILSQIRRELFEAWCIGLAETCGLRWEN